MVFTILLRKSKVSKFLKLLSIFVFIFLFFALTPSCLAQDMFWSTPEKINTSANDAILPTIVTGPNGYLHSAWMEKDPDDDEFWSGLQTPGIFYSYWNGDAWSTPFKISQNTNWTGFPGITVTSDNHVHVIWEDDSENAAGAGGRILYRKYDGNSWSTPVSISHDVSDSWASQPQIISDSVDNLHVIFSYWPPTGDSPVELYYTKYNGSSWSTPEKLSATGDIDNIQHAAIAVDSNNYPHVAIWELGVVAEVGKGVYHTNFNGTSWEAPLKLSTNGAYPKIVIDDNDYRHLVWVVEWYDSVNGVYKNVVEYIKWDGSWSASPTTISTEATYSYWWLPVTGVTYDSENNVYVGWGERVGWNGDPSKGVEVSYKIWSGISWSDPYFMRLAYDLDTPFLYKDKWDNQHLTWSEENETTHVWEFWYSVVPVNVQTYNPLSNLSMKLNITDDNLFIPSGALAVSASISAQIGPVPASADPLYTTLPRSYTFRPHGTTFAAGKEAEAKINYSDEEVIGADESNMVVYIWDSETNSWSTTFDTSVNTGKNEAAVTLPHFSLYGVMLKRVKTTWLDPLTQEKPFRLGSTIPIRFKLAYADDSPLEPGKDVELLITDSSGNKVRQFFMMKGKGRGRALGHLQYDPETGIFSARFTTEDLQVGEYEIQVALVDNPVGETTLSLTPSP